MEIPYFYIQENKETFLEAEGRKSEVGRILT